jgi:hypothetical protein
MKTNILFLSFIFSATVYPNFLFAQNSGEPETVFENGIPLSTENLSGFIAPSLGFTQMDGGNATLFNLRGGVSFRDTFSLGGYFATSVNDIRPQSELVPDVYMDYWSLGGFVEYTWNASKLVHVTFPLYLGYGEVQMDNELGDAGLGEANFLQIEPTALLEINLHRSLLLDLGAGYRMLGNMSYRNFDQSDMAGLTAYVGMKWKVFQ